MSPQTIDHGFQLEPYYDQLVQQTGFDPAVSAERVFAEFALPKGNDGMSDPERADSLAEFNAGVGAKTEHPHKPAAGPTAVIPRRPAGRITPMWGREPR